MAERVPWIKPKIPAPSISRHKLYDRSGRDPTRRAFYHSREWRQVQRLQLARVPYCERCMQANRLVSATVVHHRVEISVDPSRALDFSNLESLCASCHSRHHGRQRGSPKR